ncbi:outer membrane beta-barrel protein [Limibaculum sp. FT325]|uniref:outer membrane beta-barrel protein n=1 Tax=Thermohalobaculum sediminis TaxID=2939436 RepID=UPI0020BF7243|nr:outer membrane beta-barrel protein [Limibaculum sediminis]MCL5778127.1 outer membrane beta-barrel protein [Limibaculum sediminis]
MSADFWRYGHIGLAVLLASVSAAALAQDASSTGSDWDLDARLRAGEKYDDNIFSTENDKRGDFITVIEPEVTVEGGNETYRLGLTAAADIGVHARESGEDYEDFLLGGEGRVNLGEESFLFGGADYAWLHEERSSADDVDGTRPTKYTEASGFVGASHDFGDVGLRVGANLRRFDFGNVPAAGGGVIDNNDRDRLMGEFGARLSYDIDDQLEVFLQGLYDLREYKRRFDDAGFQRSSDGVQAAVGISGQLGPVRGEALIGVLSQGYDDARFDRTTAVDFGGKITWRPGRRTTVTGLVERTLEETTITGASGYLSTASGLNVSHRIAPDLSAIGYAFLTKNDYQESGRTDYITEIGGGLRYHLTPNFFVGGDYTFEQRSSDVAGADYDGHTFMISLGAALDPAYTTDTGFASASGEGLYGGVQFGHGALGTALEGPRGNPQQGGSLAADFAGSGVLGGAFLGYRADIGSILLGVELEGDMGAADWHHASNRNFGVERKDGIGGSAILGFRTRNDVLLYARAGAVGTSFETTYATGGAAASDTERRLGLRGGAGAEFPIGNGFSGRMEYVLTSYGDYDFGVSAPGDNFANMESVARIGLVYSLGEREARAPQPADFTGFYAGARVGHGVILTDTAGERTSGAGITTLRESGQGSGGVFGGLMAGYGHSFDAFYLGAEVEGEFGTANWNIERDPSGRLFSAQKRGAVGGAVRAGYIVNDAVLVYAKAGVVNTWFEADYNFAGNDVSRTRTEVGLRLGGGIEFPVTDDLHVNLEYTRTDYDAFTVDYGAGIESFDPAENQFGVGLTYRF